MTKQIKTDSRSWFKPIILFYECHWRLLDGILILFWESPDNQTGNCYKILLDNTYYYW